MSDLAAGFCSTLPSELMERVLSFLSAPVLFWFRTVCKRWNSLICKPAFGALCIHHARQDLSFIVVREEKRWCFLEISAWCWYTIKDCGIVDRFRIETVAMDGGLVCQTRRLSVGFQSHCKDISTIARIPPVVDMVFDTVALTYKIFLIPDGAEIVQSIRGKRFMVYEWASKFTAELHQPGWR